jgi:hypothetical protein
MRVASSVCSGQSPGRRRERPPAAAGMRSSAGSAGRSSSASPANVIAAEEVELWPTLEFVSADKVYVQGRMMNGLSSTPWESVNPFSRPQLEEQDRGLNPLQGARR